ncbi:putative 30S ribosomal protein S1 [Magnetofaba australis IT-1]|uniref:30S ribosomal protein S1 n=1 Tax=Magnetofaba australis IT-1 TaxID=1434232 RepID=A0A1Y2K7D0_9PROT|nr:putative 30S ribosomal protein S1 [Magnetofaba australis IT-1]
MEESFSKGVGKEGQVVTGSIIQREGDEFVVDVGLKSEGRLSIREFFDAEGNLPVGIGDSVDVFVERCEDQNGLAVLSREKAKREEAWQALEAAFNDQQTVEGRIMGKVKGGYTVDIGGLAAFLPGSQVDVRPVHDISRLQDETQPFDILKMDRRRGNIVVSRRTVVEKQREDARKALLETLHEGMILDGVVKNITDYGAFVDLGGLDGLLHITDMSWKRVKHPSAVVNVGDTVSVQVIKFNSDTQRISLGMKQLMTDPWEGIGAKYPAGTKFRGTVTNITDYGSFVELEPGVEGLAHVSELTWTKKNIHPSKILEVGQEVDVMVLDVDADRRRISLGLKQCQENPWEAFATQHPVGSMVAGEIKNITEFGLFVGLEGDIDGLVHLSDVTWDANAGEEVLKEYQKGQEVEAVVLSLDPDKERISLGIKQASPDEWSQWADANAKGTIVKGSIKEVQSSGVLVELGEGVEGHIRKAEFSQDDRDGSHLTVGAEVEARITGVDRQKRKISLSIKALEVQQERDAIKEYGSEGAAADGPMAGALGQALSQALENAKSNNAE